MKKKKQRTRVLSNQEVRILNDLKDIKTNASRLFNAASKCYDHTNRMLRRPFTDNDLAAKGLGLETKLRDCILSTGQAVKTYSDDVTKLAEQQEAKNAKKEETAVREETGEGAAAS